MARSTTQYVCSECGWNGGKWFGKCPNCHEWGTISEFHEARPSRTTRSSSVRAQLAPLDTSSVIRSSTDNSVPEQTTFTTGFSEYDRVLGTGIVPGAVILMAGEPGVGKSTLLLSTAGNIARSGAGTVLYISGEESLTQIRMRSARIKAAHENLLMASTTDLDTVIQLIEQEKPILAVVDSAQTINSSHVEGIPGGPTQVREVATALINVAKTHNISLLLVGHVTKDGSIAGPRTLEHLVDVVCQFEGDPQTALRLLRSTKNRFGPTDEVGCFDMSGEGIEEVQDPSGLFISENEGNPVGTCVTFTLDGHRSLPIEIQSLVTASALPSPRRATSGVDTNRIAMLIAVLYRHAHVNLLANDIYVSTIAGGLAKEPACDLGIAAALASAATNTAIVRTTTAIGEISLTGQIRPVPRLSYRIREAARLGFTRIIVPRARQGAQYERIDGVEIVEVSQIGHALHELGIRSRKKQIETSAADDSSF